MEPFDDVSKGGSPSAFFVLISSAMNTFKTRHTWMDGVVIV